MLDLAIIGGGPAGLAAGLYATRGGLTQVMLFEPGAPGGQITTSSEIENYPGVATVMDGFSFMQPWLEQCFRFGLRQEMVGVKQILRNDDGTFTLALEGDKTQQARAVIVATGSAPRRAGFVGEGDFFGRGISTCATCDGFFYKGQEVAVLGGGDTALEEALYLSKICEKIHLIHRRETFRASPLTVEKIKKNPKIKLILNAKITEAYGDKKGLSGIKINYENNEKRLDLPGLFVFVGLDPRNEILRQDDGTFLCKLGPTGQVSVDHKMRTNVDGLFAAGDLRIDAAKQVVCAAADGAAAALGAISFLEH